ncbi:MAG: thymidylate synthase, partial [Lachnospiraceae bacterium]|nr:thymidylate synthase [Lachnospiraceae bacterium]
MSRCDEYFIAMCSEILEKHITTEGEKVRPRWEDGSPAYTIKKFGQITEYDLKTEPPVLSLRRVPVKNAIDELLWIWQKKSNNIHDLGSKIWDAWADEEGSIGKAYGYQLARKYRCGDVDREGLAAAFPGYVFRQDEAGEEAVEQFMDPETGRRAAERAADGVWKMDQVDKVIYDLKNTPYSRRILTTLWNPGDLADMRLSPCAYSMTFNVTENPESGRLALNGILNQRSQDILTAFAWNEFQYGTGLMFMLAQVCGMEVGRFIHVVADAHIYDRHVDIIRELCARTPQPVPKVWINPEIHDFYAFTP